MTERHDPEIRLLLKVIDESYERKAWHGTNLKGSLRGLSHTDAAWRPAPGRHNVWEVAVHAAYWKYIARRRLLGEKRGSFPLTGSNWFPRDAKLGERAWRNDLRLLQDQHEALRDAIAALHARDLDVTPMGSKVSNASLLFGIASHDVYHAGQIQLLKRLRRARG